MLAETGELWWWWCWTREARWMRWRRYRKNEDKERKGRGDIYAILVNSKEAMLSIQRRLGIVVNK
jgi:hypothetical protein